MKTLKADVIRTIHRTSLIKDETTKGTFYVQKPSKMCLTFEEGKDMLLMKEDTFIMMENGKKSIAKGKTSEQLKVLQAILKKLFADDERNEAYNKAEVKTENKGTTIVLTVIPILQDAKSRKRTMFSSFVLTIDIQRNELKSLRMNERGQNYTHYEFSKQVINIPITNTIFML